MAAGRRSPAAGSGIPAEYGLGWGLSGGSSRCRPGKVVGGELRRPGPYSRSAWIKREDYSWEDL